MFKVLRRRVNQSAGFTLIELLAALLMASIFLLATGMIVIETMRVDREETGRTQVQAELTQAMRYIQQDLAEALYIYNDAEQPNGRRNAGSHRAALHPWLDSPPRWCRSGCRFLEAESDPTRLLSRPSDVATNPRRPSNFEGETYGYFRS
jgi:prepilin-type N-terminal cleavage/methylation domain-containing protein